MSTKNPSNPLRRLFQVLVTVIVIVGLAACHSDKPPRHPNDICKIFLEYPSWYWAAQRSKSHWAIPISIQMAIVFKESQFNSNALPPRRKLLGLIPWMRPTTALGYAQAIDDTWRRYLKSEGKISADRDSMNDALDFIGWYVNRIHRKLGIPMSDVFSLYLAYHEGINGYRAKTFRHNKKLLGIARLVSKRSRIYQRQLLACQSVLPKKTLWRFW